MRKLRIAKKELIILLFCILGGLQTAAIINIYYLLPVIVSTFLFLFALGARYGFNITKIYGNNENNQLIKWLSLQWVIILIYNCYIYIVGQGEYAFLKSSFVQLACNMLALLGGWGMSAILKKKAKKVLTVYTVIMFIIYNIAFVFRNGLNAYIDGLLSTFSKANIANPLEDNYDGIFALGILLIYMANMGHFGEKTKKKNIILLSLFLLLCGKRSQLLALALLVIFSISTGIISDKRIHIIENIVSLIMMFSYYWLIFLIKTEQLGIFLYQKHINTMGRIKMWEYITPYYDFSLKYIGHGYNFSSMLVLRDKVLGYSNYVYAWHGVAISFFVDLGFIMFGLWLFYNLLFLPNYFRKKYGGYFGDLFWATTVYLFILYLTESVINSFCTQTMYVLVLMHAIFLQKEKMHLLSSSDLQ